MDEIRIYVSASTGALDAERELLADAVLPRLRERGAAAGRGIAWELVDPEARGAAWSLKDRLRAIDDAPVFVAFLGERLGPPLPPPQAELVRRHPWLADLSGASLGEVEAVAGALVDWETRQGRRSFLYLRTPDLAVPARERLRFRAATREEAERLAQLKESLRASGQPLFDGYPCRWDADARRVVGLEALADRLVDDLWAAAGDETAVAPHPAPAPRAARPEPAPPAPLQEATAPTPSAGPPEPRPETRPERQNTEPDDTAVAGAPPAFAEPAAPPEPLPEPAAGDLPAAPEPVHPAPEIAAVGEDDIPPLPLPPSPNPIVSSLPPLRGAAPPRRTAGSGRWIAVLLFLLALAALVAWLMLRP